MAKKTTFLLIDDDEDDRELFELALEDAQSEFNFIGVASCSEALAFLKNGSLRPDYIFLDLNMPEMNGRECLAALKSSIRLSQIPVIIFSTSSDPKDKQDTAEMGAMSFITKPSKTSELTQILDQLMINQLQKLKTS